MTRAQKIVAGMQLIMKYEPDTDIAAEHDIIYFGSQESYKKMSDEEKVQMVNLGWHLDTETDSWARFV